jgi:hypothetical protein
LAETSGPEVVAVAQDLLRWSVGNQGRITWGRGTRAGSFVPAFLQDGEDHYPFAVWSSGTVEVYFQWLAARPAFTSDEARQSLRARLNAIPGMSIPADAIRRRPNIPLRLFVDGESRATLLGVFDWVLTRIRERRSDLPAPD